jgi:hypothetical protein
VQDAFKNVLLGLIFLLLYNMQFVRMDLGYKKEKELPLSGRRLHPSLDINHCHYSETDEASVRCNLFTL